MPTARLLLVACLCAVPASHARADEPDPFDRGKDHWAFKPVRRPPAPAVRNAPWARNPIDAFVLARLEAERLSPNSAASRVTLLRRLTLDLTGLPPTPAEQDAFLADARPDAYERLVDRLLASPAFGERWGRHWLDVARYADTNGYERDGDKPNAWRYRDWVVDAVNADMPYSDFVTHQLAGDEIAGSEARSQIATTFLRLGAWDDEPANDPLDRMDQLDDVLGTTTAAFLGQTVRCARCHDHFLEPFSQKDYYRLLAVFSPLRRPQAGRTDLDRPVGTTSELADFEAKDAVRRKSLAEVKASIDKLVAAKNARPKGSPFAEEAALLALQAQRRLLETQPVSKLPRAYVWFEDGAPKPTKLLRRGNPDLVGPEMSPGTPEIVGAAPTTPIVAASRSSGRRLWLARWLTRPDNPLTARVVVNRLWQHHFGRGIVGTPNDFGLQGEKPTHPELLDWLASELVASGWSLKHLHRLIVTSATYRTSSALEDAEGPRKLPLFGRMPRRRLEAEAVRDRMSATAGTLFRVMSGPGVYPPLPQAVLATQSRPGSGWGKSDERESARRSVYVFVKRSLVPPEFEQLDSPDTTASCETRIPSTTAPQALTFLNGAFANAMAAKMASRLEAEAGPSVEARVRLAYRLALCREATADEVGKATAFLAKRSLAAFCLVVMNTGEFFYID